MQKNKFGLAWWNVLSAREKEEEVAPLLDKGLNSTEITLMLGLVTRNRVITVRSRIKMYREKNGISMANWTNKDSPIPRKTHVPVVQPAVPDIETPADAPLYLAGSARRRYGRSPSVLAREKKERGYQDSDTDLGGRLSPFPTPREVSNNPNDLSRAEIHALATLYRD